MVTVKLTHYHTGLALIGEPPYVVGMSPELADEQTEALVQLLSPTIGRDRYPLSARIVA
jgi:hypothetical protein